jgi:exopolysaccharide biosynthesis WecB/TagA/CpsF family protein
MIEIIKNKTIDKLSNKGGISTFLNPYSYIMLRNQVDLLKEFDSIYIDGEWLCKFLRWFKVKNVTRCSFDYSSLAPVIFNHAEKESLKIAIVGSDSQSIEKFCVHLEKKYPNITQVYIRNGYFDNDLDLGESVKEIVRINPDILIVGMGVIKQELFLIKTKELGWKGSGFTCGGFIHQTAKSGSDYYPYFINKLNLRFIYRMYDEPKLVKRYLFDYPKFVIFFINDFLKSKR